MGPQHLSSDALLIQSSTEEGRQIKSTDATKFIIFSTINKKFISFSAFNVNENLQILITLNERVRVRF